MKKTIQQVQKRRRKRREESIMRNLNKAAKSIKRAFWYSKRKDGWSACPVEFELYWTKEGRLQLAGQSYREVFGSEYKLITRPIEQELRREFFSWLETSLVDAGIEMLNGIQKAEIDGTKIPFNCSMEEEGLAVFVRASF